MSKPTLAELFAKPPARPASEREVQLESALRAVLGEYDRLIAPLAATMGDEIPLWCAIMRARQLLKEPGR